MPTHWSLSSQYSGVLVNMKASGLFTTKRVSVKLEITPRPQLCFSYRPRKAEEPHQPHPCKIKQNELWLTSESNTMNNCSLPQCWPVNKDHNPSCGPNSLRPLYNNPSPRSHQDKIFKHKLTSDDGAISLINKHLLSRLQTPVCFLIGIWCVQVNNSIWKVSKCLPHPV